MLPLSRSTILTASLVCLLQTRTSLAQCDASSCGECLSGFNCVWNRDGTCAEACGNFPNIDCYFSRIFGGYNDIPNICDAAANSTDANENCFAQTDSVACLRQADCGWFTGIVAATGTEEGWCALDLALIHAPPPCTAPTCTECLSDRTCVWNPNSGANGTCLSSCDNFPNPDCYYPRFFGASSERASDICFVADNNETVVENEICFNQTSQDSCFDQDVRCAWLSGQVDDGTGNESGWCTLFLDDAVSGSASLLSSFYFGWMTLTMGVFYWLV